MVVLYSDLTSSKNIMNSIGLLLILAFYVLILFYIAHWAEKRSNSKWTTNPYILSFSVYIAPRGPIMEALVLLQNRA
jgi:multidrug resistance efflux pump